MRSMDSTLCTPIHEMYVVSVPTREILTRGCTEGYGSTYVTFDQTYFSI